MSRNELDVVSFVSNPKPYDAYKNVDIDAIEDSLQNGNLTPMERRRLEVIYKNCLFLQQNSFNEKTSFLSEEARSRLKKRRIEEMKREKEKILRARKLVVRTGLVLALVAGAGGLKLYHDAKVKEVKEFNEKYAVVPRKIVVKDGQTLTSIATELYMDLPDEVKERKSIQTIIDEICQTNHIEDENNIRIGQTLFLNDYEERIGESDKDKIY